MLSGEIEPIISPSSSPSIEEEPLVFGEEVVLHMWTSEQVHELEKVDLDGSTLGGSTAGASGKVDLLEITQVSYKAVELPKLMIVLTSSDGTYCARLSRKKSRFI